MKPEFLNTLPTTTRASFTADLMAGTTVALVALPLSIAIGIASGATPAAGLVTAIVAGFLISALGGSRVQIGGPTGAFIVVVAAVIAEHGVDGLVAATLMAGVILLIAGLLRIGGLVAWVPEPVVDGFTVGIAVVIATSQLPDALGLGPLPPAPGFVDKLSELWHHRTSISSAALAVTALTGVLLVLLRRIAPRWPVPILAVAVASLLSAALNQSGHPIGTIASRFGELPHRLPTPRLPLIDLERIPELLPAALTIAFLAGIESLLSAVVADRMTGGRHRPHAEVLAQGTANIASALFGGLPATGAIARTATNVRAGGQTPLAGMIHALVLLAIVLFAGPLLGHLAMPALAALLLVTAWNMSEPSRWIERIHLRRSDLIVFVLTLTLTVLADLTIAVAVGTVLGLALRLRRRHVPPTEWTTPKR